ncbi:MAG: hypothetical protein K0S26_2204 [Bacteroidota bacterium]|jgi:hypothetical protein|nr:hypothetical protein [Bacteroidota bacterium]
MTTTFIPASDNDKAVWLNNFSTKLGTYAASLGVTAAEVTATQKDASLFQYIVNLLEIYRQTLKNLTGYKTMVKKAVGQQHLSATIPSLPTLATAPPTVPEGVFDRVSKLAARIKNSVNYTDNIGSDLGIVTPASNFDASLMQPILKIKLDAGRPHLKWIKGEADALDLYVDRDDGNGFVLLGRLMRNEYVDIASLPSTKLIDEWNYKGIYVIADQAVGMYSAISSITVKKL